MFVFVIFSHDISIYSYSFYQFLLFVGPKSLTGSILVLNIFSKIQVAASFLLHCEQGSKNAEKGGNARIVEQFMAAKYDFILGKQCLHVHRHNQPVDVH